MGSFSRMADWRKRTFQLLMLKMMSIEVPNIPVLPKVRTMRGGTTPAPVATQPVEAA